MTIEKQATKYEQEIVQLKQGLVANISEKEKFKLLCEQTSSMLKKTERSLEITTKILREKEINEATMQDRYGIYPDTGGGVIDWRSNMKQMFIHLKAKPIF